MAIVATQEAGRGSGDRRRCPAECCAYFGRFFHRFKNRWPSHKFWTQLTAINRHIVRIKYRLVPSFLVGND